MKIPEKNGEKNDWKTGQGGDKLTMTNPYNLRGMIPIDSDMFFGREREMRRIGKSSLAWMPSMIKFNP
jgi:hypothetical protein